MSRERFPGSAPSGGAQQRPTPPRPDLIRRPGGPFGWLDARLLHDRWLARLGPEATAVLCLLAIAADHHGASFYGRDNMALLLSLDRQALDRALARLKDLGLWAHRPWRPGLADGVWQRLPVPKSTAPDRTQGPVTLAPLLEPLQPKPPRTPRRSPLSFSGFIPSH